MSGLLKMITRPINWINSQENRKNSQETAPPSRRGRFGRLNGSRNIYPEDLLCQKKRAGQLKICCMMSGGLKMVIKTKKSKEFPRISEEYKNYKYQTVLEIKLASTVRKSFQDNKIPRIRLAQIVEKSSGSAKRTPLSKNRDLSCGWRDIEKRIKNCRRSKGLYLNIDEAKALQY